MQLFDMHQAAGLGCPHRAGFFRLTRGQDRLADYQFGTFSVHHRFCRDCGCAPFGDGHIEQTGGDYVSVSIACLDDLTPEEMAAIPIGYSNGRDNRRWEEPAVADYL